MRCASIKTWYNTIPIKTSRYPIYGPKRKTIQTGSWLCTALHRKDIGKMILLAIDFDNLHQILRNLYTEMMPLCSNMIGVAKGIAGLGALFYVAIRVWQALARAEPIDVYPLLRPFAIGLCIMFFPTFVLGTINAVMSPVVTGTHLSLIHISEPTRLGMISYAVFCLKKKKRRIIKYTLT